MVVWTQSRFGRWLGRRRWREWWSESAVGGRRKRFAEERERPEEEERVMVAAWWLCRLSMVELVAEELVVVWFEGWNDGDREGQNWQKTKGSGWFFINFGPDFPHVQALKSTLICRRWKRIILSTKKKNCSH